MEGDKSKPEPERTFVSTEKGVIKLDHVNTLRNAHNALMQE